MDRLSYCGLGFRTTLGAPVCEYLLSFPRVPISLLVIYKIDNDFMNHDTRTEGREEETRPQGPG